MVTNRDDVSIAIRSALLKRGVQQKFSLFGLIVASFILIYVETFQNKPLDILRSTTKDIIYRGSAIVSLPEKGFQHFSRLISNHFNIIDENKRLKEENTNLKKSVNESNYLVVENLQLKEVLERETELNKELVNAKVIIDKDSPFLKSIILNKGSRENIKKGLAVLDGSNFIGRVVEVNFFSSRVLLVTDLNSKIPIVIEPKGYQAILTGTSLKKPILEFLPKNHDLDNGQKIYTSGKAGIFSPGILIGETFLENEKVLVKLESDLSQLYNVSVIIQDSFMEVEN